MTRSREDHGLAVPAVITLVGLLVFLTVLAGAGGRLLLEHRRAAVAADLAALAAATAIQHGDDACAAASRFARLNDATLARCRVADEVVDVAVEVRARVVGRTVVLGADARAGPADVDGQASSTSSSRTAPALSSGWFPLPHFGDCTHDGHPDSHEHDAMVSRVAASHSRAAWNPCSEKPAPPA